MRRLLMMIIDMDPTTLLVIAVLVIAWVFE